VTAALIADEQQTDPATGQARCVLLVDDSRLQRRILRVLLEKWGYRIVEADSGKNALKICRRRHVDFIISDWMMPGMNGLQFCAEFRALKRENYGYFILLTSKSETREVVHGLEMGADDFLAKPVNASELRARLLAGERVLGMEDELSRKNRMIGAALDELQGLYDTIDRDLMQARKIQESLVPERLCQFDHGRVSMLIQPCGHVGGDLVGMFSVSPTRLGFYNIDVSGHGVTSALMAARLAGYLSARFMDQNIAVQRDKDGFHTLRPPEQVAQILNARLLADSGIEEYFTMAYGIADLETGIVNLVQAGHPHPAIQRADGGVEFVGEGGLPLGLLPGARHQSFEVGLNPGDRLLLYSDGFVEAPCGNGKLLGEAGLAAMLEHAAGIDGPDLLDHLFRRLVATGEGVAHGDDVSALLLEYHRD